MEMHHCKVAIAEATADGQDIFRNVTSGEIDHVWANLISLVVATDMAAHFDIVGHFRDLVFPYVLFNDRAPDHRLLLMKMLIKAGDVYSIFLDWETCSAAAKKAGGGDPREQIGLIWFVARPLMAAIVEVFPKAQQFLDACGENLAKWRELL
jgi:hypothetical protein